MTVPRNIKETKTLKSDLFGRVVAGRVNATRLILRDTSMSPWVLRWLARRLLQREVRALRRLAGHQASPAIVASGTGTSIRRYIDGTPLHVARIQDPHFYRLAARALRSMHRLNVAHNDLAKEPNILVTPEEQPVFIDFQLATVAKRRNKLFRLLAREDIRHLLKHKRSYCPDALTARERRILETPSLPSRWFASSIKPAYLFVTRRLLGWADREGAGDRGSRP